MAIHDNVFALRQLASEQGMHPGDILLEFRTVTLASGTVECPTIFSNGKVIGLWVMKVDDATVNNQQAFTTDLVVTTGAITISGPTASTSVICVMIAGRRDI